MSSTESIVTTFDEYDIICEPIEKNDTEIKEVMSLQSLFSNEGVKVGSVTGRTSKIILSTFFFLFAFILVMNISKNQNILQIIINNGRTLLLSVACIAFAIYFLVV